MRLELSITLLACLFLVGCVTTITFDSLPPTDEMDDSPLPSFCNNNGVVDQPGEECDDGNDIKNDMCHHCMRTFCGDGTYNNNPSNSEGVTEQCDSMDSALGRLQCGNTTGVNASCNPFDCQCYAEEVTIPPVCGDGVLQRGLMPGGWGPEQCDAPNQAAADAQCNAIGIKGTCNLATCGCRVKCNNDGVVDLGEACDDGNANPNDACDMCKKTFCGDAKLNNAPSNAAGLKEECELGVACKNGMVCNKCQCGNIIVNPPLPPQNDSVTYCGNTIIEAGEQCDPPGERGTCDSGMVCNSECQCQTARVVTPRCGDGYISGSGVPGGGSEECDLGGRFGSSAQPDTCGAGLQCNSGCTCEPVEDEIEEDLCKGAKYFSMSSCDSHCDGACSPIVEGRCYQCEDDLIEEEVVAQCPQGTEANSCSSCGGHCVTVASLSDGTKCKQCVDCPVEAPYPSQSSCDASCDGTCSVAATLQAPEGSLSCYRCVEQVSCEDRCSQQGMQVGTGPDPNSIVSWLDTNAYCKESASLSLQTRDYPDGCSCYSYDVSVGADMFCRGTLCGDVACDSSVECGNDPIVTVTCNWGGWRWLGGQSYQAQAGVE